MDLIVGFLMDIVFYYLGYWTLKVITFGKFDDRDGKLWVSLVGIFVVVVVGMMIYFILKD